MSQKNTSPCPGWIRSDHHIHVQVIANLLSYEQPDLAVLSGDMVSGFAWDGTNGWFEKRCAAQACKIRPSTMHSSSTSSSFHRMMLSCHAYI